MQHFFNLFLLIFIIRAGVQILSDHPRLYWTRHCTPGKDWFRIQKPVPADPLWTAKQDSISLPEQIGLPGLRHSIGLARWWHLGVDALWLLNGLVFYVLLFATGHWRRLVPTSWAVFPNAVSVLIQYLSLNWPTRQRLGRLQQPAADRLLHHRLRRRPARARHRPRHVTRAVDALQADQQAAQHPDGALAALPRARLVPGLHRDSRRRWCSRPACWSTSTTSTPGRNDHGWLGLWLFLASMVIVVAGWVAATPFTLRHPRVVQRVGQAIVGPLQHLFEHVDPKPGQYSEADISPYFWHNGQYPDSDEYKALFDGRFADYRLRINGLVDNPVELDLVQLRALPHHEQITQHFCIQGWSGIAKWGGVSMQTIIDLVKPQPEAKWVVFYSLGEGADKGVYYDAHPIEHMSHHLTMLAYDMNDQPLSFGHGAPLRLRNEIELGFKQVKWIKGIEFVAHYSELGSGYGGYNQDHEFFGYRQSI